MGTDRAESTSEATVAPVLAAERVEALLSTSSILRQEGKMLREQVQESLREMRTLRSRLAQREIGAPRATAHGAHLQLYYSLTPRESELALLLAEGQTNVAIAAALGVSPHTARHHTQRVLVKLGVHSRAAAGAKIRR